MGYVVRYTPNSVSAQQLLAMRLRTYTWECSCLHPLASLYRPPEMPTARTCSHVRILPFHPGSFTIPIYPSSYSLQNLMRGIYKLSSGDVTARTSRVTSDGDYPLHVRVLLFKAFAPAVRTFLTLRAEALRAYPHTHIHIISYFERKVHHSPLILSDHHLSFPAQQGHLLTDYPAELV